MFGYPIIKDNDCLDNNNGWVKENNLVKALNILLNFDYLDLTIDPSTNNYGLRFYTLFNRLDAVGDIVPVLKKDSYVYLQADITVPAGYTPEFDNTDRKTILPIDQIRSIAFVVEEDGVDNLLCELKKKYYFNKYNLCNNAILSALINCSCDAFDSDTVFDIGVNAIDRSFNPINGKIVAYDSKILWIQAVATDIPPTFYIVPIEEICFVCKA